MAFNWAAPLPLPPSTEPVRQTIAAAETPSEAENRPMKQPPRNAPGIKPQPLVRVLPWDFRSSFPDPVDANLLVSMPENPDDRRDFVRDYHDQKIRQGSALLAGIDSIEHLKGGGCDPATGLQIADPHARIAHEGLYDAEIRKSEAAFDTLITVYGMSFGQGASGAFRVALRMWHLGGAIITPHAPNGHALPEAIQQAHFGYEEDGTAVTPSEEEIAEITGNVADFLRDMEDPRIRQQVLDQYAGDFGAAAALALDEWSRVINQAEEDDISSLQYDPGHPWHYYHEGDGAEPASPEEIPPSGSYELPKLPKNPRKRSELLQQMLRDQEKQLEDDKLRYSALVEQGVEALSDYDRNIAHGGNEELAWASAMALKYNHIRLGKTRVAALRKAVEPELPISDEVGSAIRLTEREFGVTLTGIRTMVKDDGISREEAIAQLEETLGPGPQIDAINQAMERIRNTDEFSFMLVLGDEELRAMGYP